MGMRYDIDAVFIDREGKVVALFENMSPWRAAPYIKEAHTVLESKTGFIKKMSINIGDNLVFE